MRSKWAIGVGCGLLLVAGACSNDSLSSGPTPQVEKSTLIAQGDAVCAQLATNLTQATDAFKSSHSSPNQAETLDFFTNQLLPLYDRAVGDIHRLGEPTKDRPDYDAAVRALDEGLAQYKQEISQDAVKALQSGTTAFDRADKLFQDYGFKECGKPQPGHGSTGSGASSSSASTTSGSSKSSSSSSSSASSSSAN